MNRSFKTLLLWLLISLLPIQGIAAVMATSCGKVISAAATPHAAAQHHATPAHCPSDDAVTVADGADDASDTAQAHHACSACAACCVGASAPPSVALPAAVHALSESRFAAPGVPAGSFISAGLERPPKSVFC